MTKAEVMEIINSPTKHIQIVKIDGKDSIIYSAKFVELLEAIPEMFTKNKEQVIPLSVIDNIKAEIENLPTGVELTDGSIREFTFKNCKKGLLKIIDEKVKELAQ